MRTMMIWKKPITEGLEKDSIEQLRGKVRRVSTEKLRKRVTWTFLRAFSTRC